MLLIERVVKTYPKGSRRITALAPVDLTVRAGEFVAVQGPSGSGKTTCLLIAGGLLRPDSGRVLLDGHDLHAMTRNQLAAFRSQNIGFVFQQYHLIPYLSVLENILAPEAAQGRTNSQRPGPGARRAVRPRASARPHAGRVELRGEAAHGAGASAPVSAEDPAGGRNHGEPGPRERANRPGLSQGICQDGRVGPPGDARS